MLLILLIAIVSSQLKTSYCDISQLSKGDNTLCGGKNVCPTWFTCNAQSKCHCESREDGAILCDNEKLTSDVLISHCVTYDKETSFTFMGLCFYNTQFFGVREKTKINLHFMYKRLPEIPEILLNDSACTPFHRTGLLCGDCEPGYSPLVLSYDLSCVECPGGLKNWWRFILTVFVPSTFFCFFVVFFSINVTSSRLHGVVWFCQLISNPDFVRCIFLALSKVQWQLKLVKVFTAFFSIWNLDFFNSVIPDICLNISTLQALALQYVPALYPHVLILLSYFIIKLYDRNFKVVVIAWSPFKKLRSLFRMSLDVRTSVIDSFVTFFYLSYNKLLIVSADLLIPTKIYQLSSNKTALGLYYSPTVEYFGDTHLPYAILAIVILAVFVFIPTVIIIFYPLQSFQKFLSFFPLNWHFLHAFVDSVQGNYKDGTDHGTIDCRWFCSIILLSRLYLFIIFSVTLTMMYYVYAVIVLVTFLIAIINIDPFKKVLVHSFVTDLIFFFLFTLLYIANLGRQIPIVKANSSLSSVFNVIALLTGFIPILYIMILIICWFFSRRNN